MSTLISVFSGRDRHSPNVVSIPFVSGDLYRYICSQVLLSDPPATSHALVHYAHMVKYVWAVHDFYPANYDEIQLKAGERILVQFERHVGNVLNSWTTGWLMGTNSAGKTVLFPEKYTTSSQPALASDQGLSTRSVDTLPQVLCFTDTPAKKSYILAIPPAVYFPNSSDIDVEKGTSSPYIAQQEYLSPSSSSFATETDASSNTERLTFRKIFRSLRAPQGIFTFRPPSKTGQ